jgi:hypothetical protein
MNMEINERKKIAVQLLMRLQEYHQWSQELSDNGIDMHIPGIDSSNKGGISDLLLDICGVPQETYGDPDVSEEDWFCRDWAYEEINDFNREPMKIIDSIFRAIEDWKKEHPEK